MPERLLRLPQVTRRAGLSRSTIYELLNDSDSKFQKPRKILGSRAVGFVTGIFGILLKWDGNEVKSGLADIVCYQPNFLLYTCYVLRSNE
ncbi:MAG: putative DNA-binding transcriptional regulator AlpA [Pseudohongiellaceae bacterium]|jgi:predicted DNA-binding transcriptional regulator AlpA